jgi:hypothetical protein
MIIRAGCELILSLEQDHPKPEYIKITQSRQHNIQYHVRWVANEPTSCPLRVNLYRVTKDFALETLHSHVTVYVGNPVKLNKKFQFNLCEGERICIGAKNMSLTDFTIQAVTLNVS